MISQEFLQAFVVRYNVTPGELEVLSAALKGVSTAEIGENLGIQATAVRKRLGEVYSKFDIGGKGPGKLVKLQQFLVTQYQEHTATKKVLLVWSGEEGRLLASGLKETICKHPQIETLLCLQDITCDRAWRSEVANYLANNALTICCFSDVTTAIHFNLGYLLGKIEGLKLLQFRNTFPEFLAGFPIIDSKSRMQFIELLEELLINEAEAWIDFQFPKWQNILQTTAVRNTSTIDNRSWSQITDSVTRNIKALNQNQYLQHNDCFQHIVLYSLVEIDRQMETTRTSHLVPAALYPRYLISLQRRLQITIKAITLVDRDEDFWQQETGREIRNFTQQHSIRVFVFTTPEIFERNFEILLEHAEKYRVKVISYQKLAQDFPEYCKSFGILESSQSKVLSEYITRGTSKYNRFVADGEIVAKHEKTLTAVINSAIEIEKPQHMPEPEIMLQQMREIRDLVFERSQFAVKSVGISQHFNIERCHQYGDKQDFFASLVENMLSVYERHRPKNNKTLRLLELGAKTGHFTQHLAQIERDEDIWALELDWVCYKKLEHHLSAFNSKIAIRHRDSCAYDPPRQFSYIFSCLSDRYISFNDKEKYLKNIKRNLQRDGLLIVGDEFLPPHDPEDSYTRKIAIDAYYENRLALANQQENPGLIALEEEAYNCTLNTLGDYRLDCEHYERLLRKIGFVFTKEKIDNSLYEKVGGVFVYKIWLN